MIELPRADYDVVGSIVLYKTALDEVRRSIEQFSAIPLRTHLCIIDNSPSPLAREIWSVPNVSYLFTGKNLGYGRAHNIALRAARDRSSYSLVMNTDIEYSPHVVQRLKSFLNEHPQAGLAAPQIRYPDGSLQYVCRLLPTPLNLFLRRFLPNSDWTRRADAKYELRWWDHETVANIPYYQGSFLLLRTEVCNAVGGFDERFFLYGEDIDLCRRIYAAGAALYVPDVEVKHQYRRYSSRSWVGTMHGILNNVRYFNKWGWWFDRDRGAINRAVVASLIQAGAAKSNE